MAGCCECGDELSVSGATELVRFNYLGLFTDRLVCIYKY
jgi:hypothetical protein